MSNNQQTTSVARRNNIIALMSAVGCTILNNEYVIQLVIVYLMWLTSPTYANLIKKLLVSLIGNAMVDNIVIWWNT